MIASSAHPFTARCELSTQVFGMDARQDDIFEHLAKPVVDDVLNGLNGTIFAYARGYL